MASGNKPVDAKLCSCCTSIDPMDLSRTGEALLAIAHAITSSPSVTDVHSAELPKVNSREHGGKTIKRPGPNETIPVPDEYLGEVAAAILKGRRRREKYFREGLFADPAWDMLLDLYVNDVRHRRVSVSSLCIASAVPNTTALRWIAVLEEDKLVLRRPVETDRRASTLQLTREGFILVRNFLTEWLDIYGPPKLRCS